jgi:ABC-type oligopeptide transport system substrate-binding subunit
MGRMNKEKEYHQQRRMFFIIDNNLVIAPRGQIKSHLEWLIDQYWPEEKAKEFIRTGLRGTVEGNGNIKFFTGENWEINEEIEQKFWDILPDLVEKLKINPEAEIGGGAIKQKPGIIWPERKKYGKVKKYLEVK